MNDIWKTVGTRTLDAFKMLAVIFYPLRLPKSTLALRMGFRWNERVGIRQFKRNIIDHLHSERCREERGGEAAPVQVLGCYRFPELKTLIWQAKFHNDEHSRSFMAELLCDEAIGTWIDKPLSYSWNNRPLLMHVPSTAHALKIRRVASSDHMSLVTRSMIPMILHFISADPNDQINDRRLKISSTWLQHNSGNGELNSKQNKNLSRKARIQNSEEKFTCDKSALQGKPVVLIDDILTTGATMKDAQRALCTAGVIHIYSLVLAH